MACNNFFNFRRRQENKLVCKIKCDECDPAAMARTKNVIKWLESLPDNGEWYEIDNKNGTNNHLNQSSQPGVRKSTSTVKKLKSVFTHQLSSTESYSTIQDKFTSEVPVITSEKKSAKPKIIRKRYHTNNKAVLNKAENLEAKESSKKNLTTYQKPHPYNTRLAALKRIENKMELPIPIYMRTRGARKRWLAEMPNSPAAKKSRLEDLK